MLITLYKRPLIRKCSPNINSVIDVLIRVSSLYKQQVIFAAVFVGYIYDICKNVCKNASGLTAITPSAALLNTQRGPYIYITATPPFRQEG